MAHVQVRKFGPRTTSAGNVDKLVDGLVEKFVAIADMAGVVSVVLADDLRQADDFVGLGLSPGAILQSGRQSVYPCVHSFADEAFHRAQVVFPDAFAGQADRGAQRVVADEPHVVRRHF